MTTRMIMKTTRILAMTTLRYNNNNDDMNEKNDNGLDMDHVNGDGIMKMMTSRYNDNDDNEV